MIERIVSGGQTVPRDLFGNRLYGAILADPPWHFSTYSDKGRGRSPDFVERQEAMPLLGVEGSASEAKHYQTMTTQQICRLRISDLAAANCVLFMWGVFNMLPEALRVGQAWGFKFLSSRVWVKTRVDGFDPALTLDQNFPMGTGYVARGNPEPLLIFKRGTPRFHGAPRALIIEPRREHSRKPDIVRTDIERQVDGPYLELFARTSAKGWDVAGDQVNKFTEASL